MLERISYHSNILLDQYHMDGAMTDKNSIKQLEYWVHKYERKILD